MEEETEKKDIIANKSEDSNLNNSALIKERKEKVLKFLKERNNLLAYLILAIIVFITIKIRTLPMNIDPATGKPRLWDITTDSWTLGPDLDPFLFLRWSEYIVDNGKLFTIDPMRYVPAGYDTKWELLLHPYLMAWFHKIATLFGSESVTYSAIIFPVFMFSLSIMAFFLLTKTIFIESAGNKKANIIALVSAFFLSIFPVFLPRTIAGIPEKEASAFFFIFISLYLFLKAWKTKNKLRFIFAVLAGMATGAAALSWGGYNYIFITIGATVFLSFLLDNIDRNRFYTFVAWFMSAFIIMKLFSLRYTFSSLIANNAVIIAVIILLHFLIYGTRFRKYAEHSKLKKIPKPIISTVISVIILSVAASIIFGFNYIPARIGGIIQNIVKPIGSRLIQTVAENRQPFFVEWVGNYGPIIKNSLPLYFWLFAIGSIYLFYYTIIYINKRYRWYLTLAYTYLIFSIPFSRYASNSLFNGENTISMIFYGSGFLIFVMVAGAYYFKYYNSEERENMKKIDFNLIALLTLFIVSLISARGLIRLAMVLAPSASIIVSYFAVQSSFMAKKNKGEVSKIFAWIIAFLFLVAVLFSGWLFYGQIQNESTYYAPSIYTQQWQKAMAWVRENTPTNSVFGHWWDYGYWLQSIGRRATVLDGGNAISYWNHLMGRYALTGPSEKAALEFLYAHNTTHFLIDSSDLGKYSAFSLIGSDENYDRASNLPSFLKDRNQMQETKNSTIFIYNGGSYIDEDIIYDDNGTRIFLPAGKAGLGAVLIEENSEGEIAGPPQGIYVYQESQYKIPMRYAYSNGRLHDFNQGIEAGVFLMPYVEQNNNQLNLENRGALIYLSNRTVNSQLARLYLYQDPNSAFKLVHNEDDFLITQIKANYPSIEDIVYFNGVRGPIRIWEINYPSDIEFKEEYLNKEYPQNLESIR